MCVPCGFAANFGPAHGPLSIVGSVDDAHLQVYGIEQINHYLPANIEASNATRLGNSATTMYS